MIRILVILLFALAGLKPFYNTNAHISTTFPFFPQYFPQSKNCTNDETYPAPRLRECRNATHQGLFLERTRGVLTKIPSGRQTVEGTNREEGGGGGGRKRRGDNKSLEKKGEKGERLVAD